MNGFLERLQPEYLERHSDGLFAEPFNALSNIAFFVAAYLLYRVASRDPEDQRWECRVLPPLLAAIGAGSLLFHTARNGYTFLCDVVPIGAFIVLAMFSLVRGLIKNNGLRTAFLLTFALIQTMTPRAALNGSAPYIVTLAILLTLIPAAIYKCGRKAMPLILLSFSLAAAIIFRAIDLAASPVFPMGTHWLWHIFATISAYLAAKFVIQETNSRLT